MNKKPVGIKNSPSVNQSKNIALSLKSSSLTRSLISLLVISSLTACGGGSSTLPAATETDIYLGDYNYPYAPYNLAGIPVTYDNTSKIIPSNSVVVSAVPNSGTYTQQTLPKADDVWALGYKGQGVTIGVVDSGVNPDHVDFYDDSSNTRINWDDARGVESSNGVDITINNNYADIDVDHHGTHVSSIALGREYGVAPEANLLPINVFFDNNSAYNTAIHVAVNYAAEHTPIVNASITGMVNLSTIGDQNSEFNAYLTTLKNNDSALIVAAGNGGADEIGDPIGAEHFINHNDAQNLALQTSIANQVLSVIAIDNTGTRANFSDYPGSCNDVGAGSDVACDTSVMADIQNTFIAAPGVNIEAADGSNDTGSVIYSGTSMATPVVSGALALLMSAWDQLTIQDAVKLLKENADQSFSGYSAAEYGVGILDILAAFEPSGDLKTPSSLSSPASFSLGESSASIPSGLSGLAGLAALKSVAYVDDYNRDFMVDITPAIQLEKTAIDWNNFWLNSQSDLTTQMDIAGFTISTSFDNYQSNTIKNFALQNKNSSFQYAKNSSNSLIETTNNPLTNNFYSNNQKDFGSTFVMQQEISPNLSVFTALQEQDNSFSRVQNTQSKTLAQVQTMGLKFQVSPKISIGASTQLRQEHDSLMGLQGSGTFSFGEENLSQLNTLSLQYSANGTHLYSHFQNGELLNSNQAAGSCININQAKIGQFKLGLMQELTPKSAWGLQAYNYNRLINSDMTLTIPIGVTANGEIENQTISYTQKHNLQPDTVELFYKSASANNFQYQLNAISSPDDTGIGFTLHNDF